MKIDSIFVNGRIRTLDADHPTAKSVGVHNGRIVGFDDDLRGLQVERKVDLAGSPVLPGFNDAHNHLTMTGMRLSCVSLRPDRIGSLDQLYAAVRKEAATLPGGAWVRGAGYDQNFLEGHPDADALDAVSAGHPVMLEHVSGHMMTVNSAAFERAGYSDRAAVPDFDGGAVGRTDDGRANGLLQERAMSFMYEQVRPIALDDVQRNLRLASDQAVRYGLTSITEPGIGDYSLVGNSPVDFHSYQVAVESGALLPRITLMPLNTTLHDVEGFRDMSWFGLDLGVRTGFGDDRLRMGPVKIVSDGSFIGRSAAMHRCYHGEPDNHGVLQYDPKHLHEMIIGAHDAGWTVATHAVGDAAIDHVLDAVEEAQRQSPRPDVRHRIEHFAYTTGEQVRRAASLGIIGVPQGSFISDFGDGLMDAVDSGTSGHIFRMKSLLNAGMVLPGSTDAPVSEANPLVSIHNMVNRRTASGRVLGPQEKLSVAEAVRAYTYGSAYAVGDESEKGTLRVGQLADMVVLSEDVFDIDVETIRDVTVGATVIGGDVVYGDLSSH